jgi:hypothetical protein
MLSRRDYDIFYRRGFCIRCCKEGVFCAAPRQSERSGGPAKHTPGGSHVGKLQARDRCERLCGERGALLRDATTRRAEWGGTGYPW